MDTQKRKRRIARNAKITDGNIVVVHTLHVPIEAVVTHLTIFLLLTVELADERLVYGKKNTPGDMAYAVET